MMKFILKYCLSFCLILLGAFAFLSTNQDDFQLASVNTHLAKQEANIHKEFGKNFFNSNSGHDKKSSNHIVFENEVDDDETKSDDDNNNRIAHLNISNNFRTPHYLSRVKNILPEYSLQANTSTSWYILYRVIRI